MTTLDDRPTRELAAQFAPLDLEQGLYLLDKLTWFPEDGPDRSERIAEYVAARTPQKPALTGDEMREVIGHLVGSYGEGSRGTGRWGAIPEAKLLYELKYDLKFALLPERFFS